MVEQPPLLVADQTSVARRLRTLLQFVGHTPAAVERRNIRVALGDRPVPEAAQVVAQVSRGRGSADRARPRLLFLALALRIDLYGRSALRGERDLQVIEVTR